VETKTVGDDRSGQTKPVGFWEAFWFWVKLGFINFGGPLPARSPSCTASLWKGNGGSLRDST
jgi:hypothetical protein